MADATYDAVIIGGGTKSMVTAMYLSKYTDMSVGIFERRKELGGSMKQREGSAPGFVSDFCATEMEGEGYLPIERDFPDYEEKGCMRGETDVHETLIRLRERDHVSIYNVVVDPSGERSAEDIARAAGEKDAETFLKVNELYWQGGLRDAQVRTLFNLHDTSDDPIKSPVDKWFEEYFRRPDPVIDESVLRMHPFDQAITLWQGELMRYFSLAHGTGMVPPVGQGGALFGGMAVFRLAYGSLPHRRTRRGAGGTHGFAHGYIRILLEQGVDFWTNEKVVEVIIENGTAKGIRLEDGTEVEARKLVVSGVPMPDLALELIGKDHLSPEAINTGERLINRPVPAQETWYTWALHERPHFWAADENPDIDLAHGVFLGTEPDPEALIRRGRMLQSGKEPPGSQLRVMLIPTELDGTRAPAGKVAVMTGENTLGPKFRTVREWMEYKKAHAEKTIEVLQQFAPNMTWDNIIGYDALTPWDHRDFHLRGGMGVMIAAEDPCEPIPGFVDFRTPVKNLYGTGDSWVQRGAMGTGFGGGLGSEQGYVCYKAIAQDFHLENQPWEGCDW